MKKQLFYFLCILIPLTGMTQTMVLFVPTLEATFTGRVTYNGVSPISDGRGVGFYNESVPSTSTLAVEIFANIGGGAETYTFSASNPASGFSYNYSGPIQAGTHLYTMTPSTFTPNTAQIGTLTMTLTDSVIQGTVTLLPRIDVKSLPADQTAVVPIVVAGHTWMDRPLGAHRRSTDIYNDPLAVGSNFQWGRKSDGHEITVRNGDNANFGVFFTNTYVSTTSYNPTHGQIILNNNINAPNQTDVGTFPGGNKNWQPSPPNNGLWLSSSGAPNDPCPSGYRIPFASELLAFFSAAFGGGNGGFNDNVANPPFVTSGYSPDIQDLLMNSDGTHLNSFLSDNHLRPVDFSPLQKHYAYQNSNTSDAKSHSVLVTGNDFTPGNQENVLYHYTTIRCVQN